MGASSLGNERRRRQLGEHIQVVKVEIFGNRIIFVGKCGERMNLDFNEWKALKKEVKKRKAEAETKYKDDFARHINQSPIFPKNRPIEKCDDCKNSPNLCLSCQQKYLVWSPNLVD